MHLPAPCLRTSHHNAHTHTPTRTTDGPLSKENPSSAADLRILCAGKFLENARALKGALDFVHVCVLSVCVFGLHACLLICWQCVDAPPPLSQPIQTHPLPPHADISQSLKTNKQRETEYRREMGDPEAGAVVTMHVLVRPAAASGGGKAGAAGGAKEGAEAARPPKSGCGCVIC